MKHSPTVVDNSNSPHTKLYSLSFSDVTIDGGLWKNRQTSNREISLHHGYDMLEESGALDNFRIASGKKEGEFQGMRFQDSDLYKWLEAVAYELAQNPNEKLQTMANTGIDLIEAAQDNNGYINTYYQITQPVESRWAKIDHDHELYCAGHLIQAAVAYHRATGDDRLIKIVCKFADHIDDIFGKGKIEEAPGHPEIEMALVELYRDTNEKRYFDLAQFFLDERGEGTMRGWEYYKSAYYQDRVPVRENDRVEGHAVRALYLTAGMADVYMETGEQALFNSMIRQWDDMVNGKMYITGGAGARHEGEAFGEPYELPDEMSYCETCAAIASVFWNWRMLLITGEKRYADLIERTLFNGFLSGISIDGKKTFYVNPLLVRDKLERQEWHRCACCPPNAMRLISSINNYLATSDSSGLQIHQYAPAKINYQPANGEKISMKLETNYPWDGQIKLSIVEGAASDWSLKLRVPDWCSDSSLTVNGQTQSTTTENGNIILQRTWEKGDTVELNLSMRPRLMQSHPRISAIQGSVAIERGPLVYCLEQPDLPDTINLMDIRFNPNNDLQSAWVDDLLGGVTVIEAEGYAPDMQQWQGQLYNPYIVDNQTTGEPIKLRLIPYYLWANREPGAMRVWLPT
jgi:uncharacterized protein